MWRQFNLENMNRAARGGKVNPMEKHLSLCIPSSSMLLLFHILNLSNSKIPLDYSEKIISFQKSVMEMQGSSDWLHPYASWGLWEPLVEHLGISPTTIMSPVPGFSGLQLWLFIFIPCDWLAKWVNAKSYFYCLNLATKRWLVFLGSAVEICWLNFSPSWVSATSCVLTQIGTFHDRRFLELWIFLQWSVALESECKVSRHI